MEMNKIEELMKNPTGFASVVEQAEEHSVKEELLTSVKELTESKSKTFSEAELEVIGRLVEGDNELGLEESFSQFSELATNLFGDWNEEAARTAVLMYKENGGEIKIESDKTLTLGELYGLAEDHEAFGIQLTMTESARSEIEDTAFLGENKTVLVTSFSQALVAARLGNESAHGKFNVIDEKQIALLLNEQDGVLCSMTPETKYEEALSVFEGFGKELDEEVFNYLKESFEMPLEELFESNKNFEAEVVSNKEIVDLYMAREYTANEYFAPLVGLIRKYKITEEDYKAASSAYKVFGISTLEKLLEKSWISEEEPTVEPVTNPTESAPKPQPEKTLEIIKLFKNVSN